MKFNLSASYSHMTCMLWFFIIVQYNILLVSSVQIFWAREGNLFANWHHGILCLALKEKKKTIFWLLEGHV